jgi:heat-inducible transcriptional repressor
MVNTRNKSSISPRQKILLHWIVCRYVDTAVPVASEQLVKSCGLDVSPATVRNDMADLEKMGLIQHPHVSAGRIPTDEGYRYFVNHLMKSDQPDAGEKRQIREAVETTRGDIQKMMESISRILGFISNELAVVITPSNDVDRLDQIEFIDIASEKVMVVIRADRRRIRTYLLKIGTDMSTDDLIKAAKLLNERLSGLPLDTIRQTIAERLGPIPVRFQTLIRQVIDRANILFDFSGSMAVHVHGTQNILAHPEFTNSTLLERLFAMIDDKRELVNLFQDKLPVDDVTIGRENRDERLCPFSVVRSHYRIGMAQGTFGVIGPTRMKYARIIPLVSHISEFMITHLG